MSNIQLRPAHTLPSTDIGWLQLRDHFVATVGEHSGQGQPFGPLMVLADATFAAHSAFPIHPHREVEILSIVLAGQLSHRGDLADGTVMPARSAQLISSRSGMVHAEANDADVPCRMLQIWFRPTTHGGAAQYFQRDFQARGRHVIAGDEAMPLRCDVRVEWIDLEARESQEFRVAPGRAGYLMSLDGWLATEVGMIQAGEGAEIRAGMITVTPQANSAVLFIDFAV